MLQLPGGWPPPTPVPVEGGRHIEPWQAGGGEPLRFLVKRQHCSIYQQRGQEAATAKEAPEGRAIEGGRSAWQPGHVYLRGHHNGAQEGEGPHDDIGLHSPKQAGDRKHPVLLRGGGGWREDESVPQPPLAEPGVDVNSFSTVFAHQCHLTVAASTKAPVAYV